MINLQYTVKNKVKKTCRLVIGTKVLFIDCIRDLIMT